MGDRGAASSIEAEDNDISSIIRRRMGDEDRRSCLVGMDGC